MEDNNDKNSRKNLIKCEHSETYTDVCRDIYGNIITQESGAFNSKNDKKNSKKDHFVNSEDEKVIADLNDYVDNIADTDEEQSDQIESEHDVTDIDYCNYAQEIYDCEGSGKTRADVNAMNEKIRDFSDDKVGFSSKELMPKSCQSDLYTSLSVDDCKRGYVTTSEVGANVVGNTTGDDKKITRVDTSEEKNQSEKNKSKDKKEDKGLTL